MSSDRSGADGIRGIGKLPPPALRIDERTKNPSKRKNPREHPEREMQQDPPAPKGKIDISA
ncbi:MAG: hypothetical protein ACXWW2_05635 [Candidatus Deferrimicrobiaceae bacterium]